MRLDADARHHLVSVETHRLQRGPGIHNPDPALHCSYVSGASLCAMYTLNSGTTNCIMTCELNCKVS